MQSVNPATGELLKRYSQTSLATAREVAAGVAETADTWRQGDLQSRASLLKKLESLLLQNRDPFSELMTCEMGKPIREARSEVEKCATVCSYYAERGSEFLREQDIPTEASQSYVGFEPLGVILAIMPWNFPFWQVFRFAAAAVMAGNGVVLKHASNVSGCAVAIEEAFGEAGFPPELFRAVFLSNNDTMELIGDEHISAVTLTGSVRAGRAVAARAGQALKKTVLELGGSDPYVVLSDAEVAQAAEVCVKSRLINTGQSCIAAKRFVVVEALRQPFERAVVRLMQQAHQGDPRDPETELGPMARVDLRDELHAQVQASTAKGAKLLLGGELPDRPGAWYPATVLTDVAPGMPAYDDELFGPVAAILPAADDERALCIANDSRFGLGAAVFTADARRGERIARQELRAGSCFVNTFVRSDPRLPFGGIKDSGYGRELGSFGLLEFVNVKTIYVE